MKNYVKNEPGYNDIEFDVDKVKDFYKEHKKIKKMPTSINLSEEVITNLKSIAQKRGLGYQTLMRMLIMDGLNKIMRKNN